MSKDGPKKDPGLFGDVFDLDGDGRTDAAEAALMFMMFDEMQKEEERERQANASFCRTVDLDDIDIDDGITDLDDLDIEGI